MPGWAKALIIVVALMILLVVGVIAAGAFWWSRNKDALLARGKAVIEEGEKAGRETDNQGCEDRTVTRYKAEPGITNAIASSIFFQSCLTKSKATPGYCDEVPGPTEFIRTGQWELQACGNVGLESDQYCRNLFQAKQKFCEMKKQGKDA